MKIGIFTECYKPILNGVVTSITNYKNGFEKLGHKVTIFSPTYKQKPEKNVIYFSSKPLPGKSGYQYIFPFSEDIIQRASEMDIIHAHHPFLVGKKALKLANKIKKPFIFTNHTQYEKYTHYVPLLGSLFKKGLNAWLADFAKKCDLVTTPSEGMKKKLIENGFPKNKTIAVTNGIQIEKFNVDISEQEKQKIRQEIGLNKKDIVLIFTGRIASEKNLDFLFKAFQKIHKQLQDTKLILIGGGPEENKFKEMANTMSLADSIFLIGPKPYQEMYKYYHIAHLFTFPSKSETQGLVTIEAMAAGLPAVAIKATGTEDIVENGVNGYMTNENLNEFSNQVINVLKNKTLYGKLAQNAPKSVEKFSVLSASKKMIEAYQKAIKNHQNDLTD